MRIIITFDDGREDNYLNAFPILKKYHLTATFFVVTGFVDGTFSSDVFGKGRLAMSVEQLQDMKSYGMEIASHGDRHIFEPGDYKTSVEKLKKWDVVGNQIGFSIPGSKFSKGQLKDFLLINAALPYIRGGRSPSCYSFMRKVSFVLYHWTKAFLFFDFFNRPNLQSSMTVPVYSLVVRSETREKSLERFIKKNQAKDVSLTLMFHSILDHPQNPWEWKTADFEKFCSFLSSEPRLLRTLTALELCSFNDRTVALES